MIDENRMLIKVELKDNICVTIERDKDCYFWAFFDDVFMHPDLVPIIGFGHSAKVAFDMFMKKAIKTESWEPMPHDEG